MDPPKSPSLEEPKPESSKTQISKPLKSILKRRPSFDPYRGVKDGSRSDSSLTSSISELTQELSVDAPVVMLNQAKISELFNKNVDKKLYPCFTLMTINGTLLAYSDVEDISVFRRQTAIISLCWKDHAEVLKKKDSESSAAGASAKTSIDTAFLETLTIETDGANIIARLIQPKLLVVLIGGVPPNRQIDFRMTPEKPGDPRYPSTEFKQDEPSMEQASTSASKAPAKELTEREKDIKLGLLHIQRKKLDVVAGFIKNKFDEGGFVMDQSFA
ncbi:MAG: hypothetical protein M1820_009264 [Bogoriella megaspora]|nr:MAG: hypothetical protein M1820_009264 [Bogoriella megaspora]